MGATVKQLYLICLSFTFRSTLNSWSKVHPGLFSSPSDSPLKSQNIASVEQFKCLVLLRRRKYPLFIIASVFQLCLCMLAAGWMNGGLLPDFFIGCFLPIFLSLAYKTYKARKTLKGNKEASLLPGVVLQGKLCTLYLDIYLKTNLLFWDCSLSLLLSVFPLFLSLLPLCVCLHTHVSVYTPGSWASLTWSSLDEQIPPSSRWSLATPF